MVWYFLQRKAYCDCLENSINIKTQFCKKMVLMTRYIYPPHFCLIIFAQNIWKEKSKEQIIQEVTKRFQTFEKRSVWGT